MKRREVVLTVLLSAGLIFPSVAASHADQINLTPGPIPVLTLAPLASSYEARLASYKTALAAYQAALQDYQSAWKATLDQYNAAVQVITSDFKVAQELRRAKREAITAAFQSAVANARAEKKAYDKIATTPDQKSAAQTILTAAISAAAIARQVALDALGPELTRPILPAKPVKPPEPVKPTPPAKVVATIKAFAKPTSTKSSRVKKPITRK